MVKVFFPKPRPKSDLHNHCNDTFRELVMRWGSLGLCEIEYTDSPYVWINKVGDILLYDRPTLDWLDKDLEYNIGLFGNPIPVVNGRIKSPWIFWGRHPTTLHNIYMKPHLSYSERNIESIFIGKIENSEQKRMRKTQDWSGSTEIFEMSEDAPPWNGVKNKYNQETYLNLLSRSKFGLCLPGFGMKCNREIELMALGVVPIITPSANTTYVDELVEGKHYFYAKTPEDVRRIIAECTEDKWKAMSLYCREWYERNGSPQGSFNTTIETVNHLKTLPQKMSFCTISTDNTIPDLELLLTSIRIYHPYITTYIACGDDKTEDYIKNNFGNMNTRITRFTLDRKGDTDIKDNNQKWQRALEMGKSAAMQIMTEVKPNIISEALKHHQSTLCLDADIVFLAPIFKIFDRKLFNYDIGLFPHYIQREKTDKFGYYNAGMIFFNHPCVVDDWRDFTRLTRYFDQATLEDLAIKYRTYVFDDCNDFGWWRFFQSDEDPNDKIKHLSIGQYGWMFYRNRILSSIHTHFYPINEPQNIMFSNIIIQMLDKTSNNCLKYIYKTIVEQNKK